jgi:hypothetical protein
MLARSAGIDVGMHVLRRDLALLSGSSVGAVTETYGKRSRSRSMTRADAPSAAGRHA